MKLGFVLGTRPEAIKLAPVVRAAQRRSYDTTVISTGQHREMLDQMLVDFEITPNHHLDVMRERQQLGDLTSELVKRLSQTLRHERPDVLLVQGDTSTAFCGALTAFYERIPVGHVEAGLRTDDISNPFPEEANRRLVARLAQFHFCPTERSRANLLQENIAPDGISVVGNTVIDALNWACMRSKQVASPISGGGGRLLVTLHRRENHGETMGGVAETIRELASRRGIDVLFPVHRSPAVREVVFPILQDVPNVTLCEPLDYFDFVGALQWCDVVLTDSGGVQEEAPSLGKPVLVARETTERPEAIEAGVAKLVGTNPVRIYDSVAKLFDDADEYATMARTANPFGDGTAAEQILHRLDDSLPRLLQAA
jgi:UDP-N-acetylglucosamine 2-epimerase (non-hydrolysing)